MHMAQVLPLEASYKYSAIQVSYDEPVHKCCVTNSTWQLTFGPHDLLNLHGTIHVNEYVFLLTMVLHITFLAIS